MIVKLNSPLNASTSYIYLQFSIDSLKCDSIWKKCQRLFKFRMKNLCTLLKLQSKNQFIKTLTMSLEPKLVCPLKPVEYQPFQHKLKLVNYKILYFQGIYRFLNGTFDNKEMGSLNILKNTKIQTIVTGYKRSFDYNEELFCYRFKSIL